jgi:glycerol-3-phosphate dehydrogenase
MDPDFKLPETDIDGDTDPEEVEIDTEELELLVKEAEESLPKDHLEET